MKKTKAIELLELQKERIKDADVFSHKTWNMQTSNLLKEIFGDILYRISDKWLAAIIGLLGLILPGVFFLGKEVGEHNRDADKITELQRRLDSVSKLSTRVTAFPDANPISDVKHDDTADDKR